MVERAQKLSVLPSFAYGVKGGLFATCLYGSLVTPFRKSLVASLAMF
jgi:hypothetical protein